MVSLCEKKCLFSDMYVYFDIFEKMDVFNIVVYRFYGYFLLY